MVEACHSEVCNAFIYLWVAPSNVAWPWATGVACSALHWERWTCFSSLYNVSDGNKRLVSQKGPRKRESTSFPLRLEQLKAFPLSVPLCGTGVRTGQGEHGHRSGVVRE